MHQGRIEPDLTDEFSIATISQGAQSLTISVPPVTDVVNGRFELVVADAGGNEFYGSLFMSVQ